MPDVIAPLLSFISTALVAVVAAVLSYAAGKGMKRHEWDLNIRREKVAIRQRLYAEFLAEANRLILQSIEEKSSTVTSFFKLTRKFSEIELISPDTVSAAAKSICDHVICSHAVQQKMETNFYELKQAFILQARQEIASFEK
ncbi:conserved hypothetical protein [uncultured Defluviicoccus sp.]|uniref:Uncharacterized protein n=1 Tax=metagenome TaxID=256318 RepID=A0A380TGH4_9ZZZZ|nr:conserved hypothetical protein [uncultured Defluviicoccus sp.]